MSCSCDRPPRTTRALTHQATTATVTQPDITITVTWDDTHPQDVLAAFDTETEHARAELAASLDHYPAPDHGDPHQPFVDKITAMLAEPKDGTR